MTRPLPASRPSSARSTSWGLQRSRSPEPTADETERARTYFNAGAQAYASAKYADAVRSFEQAFAIAPRPQVLFSLAQAEPKDFLIGRAARPPSAIAHTRNT